MLKGITLGLLLSACAVLAQAPKGQLPLPSRLVLCLDGVSFRDVQALQASECVALDKRKEHPKAFQQGYFTVTRLIYTFHSCSDVAWTEMFGNPPLPGYQRSYFDITSNHAITQNGITTTMEYESQMHWQVQGGWRRKLGYVAPVTEFKHEVRALIHDFLNNSEGIQTYYAMLRTTDDAQHLSGDIQKMLTWLDQQLTQLQAEYRHLSGRQLEILILSDHGNNHAGPGKRVRITQFLKRHGYRIRAAISSPRDVVLPTVGIQSWVEIHNAPERTFELARTLVELEGVELVTARLPGKPDTYLVLKQTGEYAQVEYRSSDDRFRYTAIAGDPLAYQPVVCELKGRSLLDEQGFASALVWATATLSHRFPDALERIVRGLSCSTQNPADILLSLDNHYVHAPPLVLLGSRLVTCSGTHGGLDDLNSTGILLSNFLATHDTTTSQLAAEFQHFAGRHESKVAQLANSRRSGEPQSRAQGPEFWRYLQNGRGLASELSGYQP